MRPIKFRAWDKVNGYMVYEGWAVKFKPEREKVSGIMLEPDQTPNCERIYGEWNDSDSIILMQFTGLHDKNGKEIWEGDVVRHGGGDICTVYWEQEGCCFRLKSDKAVRRWYISFPNTCEVLGNIYENQDLIK